VSDAPAPPPSPWTPPDGDEPAQEVPDRPAWLPPAGPRPPPAGPQPPPAGPQPPPAGPGPRGWAPGQWPPVPPPSRRRALLPAVLVVALLAVLATGGGLALVARGRDRTAAPATTLAPPVPTAPPATTPPTSAPPANGQARSAIAGVERRVEEVRDLRFTRAVPTRILSPAKLAAELLRVVDADTDEAALTRQGRALVLLGALRPGTDLPKLIRSVQAESVLGFYVPGRPPGKGRLYVRSSQGLDPYAEFVLSHELTHAVTDQHFDLTRSDRLQAQGRDDEVAAYSALAEGDATLTMQRYLTEKLTTAQQLAVAGTASRERTPKLDAAPAALRESLLFPYQTGLSFVRALYDRGGWAAVNRAYADPPTSTEQVMHPEKFLARDRPQPVAVPDLARALGAGWRPAAEVQWGEFDTQLVLAGELPVTVADAAAEGWDGGRLRTFERGGRTALVLRTVWDSPGEASEFCRASARWATARLGPTVGPGRWSGHGQELALACRDTRATLLSAPDRPTLAKLSSGLGRP